MGNISLQSTAIQAPPRSNIQGWHILFTASTRPHFLQLLIDWRKHNENINTLSSEGLKGVYVNSGEILYYYDFLTCHQYSKVMMERLINVSIDKLEKDFRRYILMLANDNRIVGKLLQRSVGRKVVWYTRKRAKLEEKADAIDL